MGWRTFGTADFMRVPFPAARTTAAADIHFPSLIVRNKLLEINPYYYYTLITVKPARWRAHIIKQRRYTSPV
jgi:hypothetical protein